MSLEASEIRYTQDSIKSSFRNGDSIHDASVHDMPAIEVFYNEDTGAYHSADNRRLYVLKQADCTLFEGSDYTMIGHFGSGEEAVGRKYTTSDDGLSIDLR